MRAVTEAREARGWSQVRLAKEARISRVSLVHIEQGLQNPTVATLEKIADALEIEVSDLFPRRQPELPPDDIAGYVRRLNLRPELYFADVAISDPDIHRPYEVAYVTLLRAELAADKGDRAEAYSLFIGAADALNRLAAELGRLPGPARNEVRERIVTLYERVLPGLRAGVEMYEAAERRAAELVATA